MIESNSKKADQPTGEQQSSEETQTEYRDISVEEKESLYEGFNKETQIEYRELSDEEKQILEAHKKWLDSGGDEGNQADLENANLSKADLREVDLKKAKLRGANLQNANLREADLRNANLKEANLQKADFYRADLQKANLYNSDMRNISLHSIEKLSEAELGYANLEGATGLLGDEFAQADVTGTKLPDDIKEFKALETVKEISQNARKIFFAMLLGCVYSWLTIATTTDVRLITNTASSPLPIIGTEIPIAGFYWAAPLVLICLYLYFHLYLDNLWKSLASLPAIFPDGKPLDQTAYPWLLNSLVCRHFKILKNREELKKFERLKLLILWILKKLKIQKEINIRQLIFYSKEWITIFLAWWVVPITMIGFWIRYIPRHDWVGTIFHIGLIVLSVAFAIIFYRLCALTLQGKKKSDFRIINFLKDRRFYYGVSVIIVGVTFSLYSYGAIEGVRSLKPYFSDIKKLVPWASEKLGYGVFADFREKIVTETPSNYGMIAKEERLEFVKGANLKGRNLIYADMSDAFLVKADFRWALLNGAAFVNANLQQADFREANLQQADLREANLQEANLKGVELQQSDLRNVYLEQADLWDAELQQANLEGANLQKAEFIRANLQQANLWRANLQQAVLRNAYLQKAYLREANLQEADLRGVNLQQANFRDADLENTNLILADLKDAKNLTIEQLSKVKTLYQAKLDPDIMEEVKKCCPHLLEKPKEETDKTN